MTRTLRPSLPPRTLAAVAGGKLASGASRRLSRGGGTALPGLIAAAIDPGIVRRLARRLGLGSIVITGTNGKTTTARMLASIAHAAGLRVVHNRSGSNLMRGLASTAVDAMGWLGGVPQAANALGVFEVDEATVPLALPQLAPRAVVFTNLFRDQLDRYGEVDSISALWRRALERLDPRTALVLNADDPSVAELARQWPGRSIAYGLDDPSQAIAGEHAADSRWCPSCGTEYAYAALYVGHVGIWRCPGCGAQRPAPQVTGSAVRPDAGGGTRLQIGCAGGDFEAGIALGGLYNVYNALAACAGAVALDLPKAAMRDGLRGLDAAFGRQEALEVRGRRVQILLCKNPAGTNQVLRYLSASPAAEHLLMLLNDGIADGRDVSWIWDVDYEALAGRASKVVVSGRRAADLMLRLKYAGLSDELVLEPGARSAIDRAITLTPPGACLSVLPTYTAMLEVRDRLAQLAGRRRFWQT